MALDVETTGSCPLRGHRIREIALLDEFGGGLNTPVLPREPKARAAALAAGTSSRAPAFEALAGEVIYWLRRGVIVGFNVTFDLQFLSSELSRCGRGLPTIGFVDVLPLARKAGLTGSLASVAASLGLIVDPDRLHGAAYDAALARIVLDRLTSRLRAETFGDLIFRQFTMTSRG